MKILVLQEARVLETGYHYTNSAALIGILGSGIMKATNRKIGLELSRIDKSSLETPLKNLLKPVKDFDKEKRDLAKKYRELNRRLNRAKKKQAETKYDNQKEYEFITSKIKDYKKEIKKLQKLSDTDLDYIIKLMNQNISSEDLEYFKNHLKDWKSITLKYAIENNLIDKRIAFMINVDKINAEYWDKDIIRRELGQSSEEENSQGVRNSGDNMYKNKSWSYTRSNIPVYSTKIKPELVRISLDIEKISQRQPVDSFAWRKVSKNSNKTEVEERVVGDTPNIGKYIKSIDFPEEVFDEKSKYITYKGDSYPACLASDLEREIKSIRETGKFPYYSSIIKKLIDGTYELKPVKNYFIKAIENDLELGKAKGVGMELDIKNKNIKTFDSLLKFIENATYTTYNKKPGGKNKKKIIHKLNIKIGTFKFSKNRSWEYTLDKELLEEIDNMITFYKTGELPEKKIVPKKDKIKEKSTNKKDNSELEGSKDTNISIPKKTESNKKEPDNNQENKISDITNSTNEFINNHSLELAKNGLTKLGNHIGKVYLISIERNGKIAWSNFLLSNNINIDLKKLSSQLKPNELLKTISPKHLSDKIKNPPLRNYERAISRKFYLPELTKYAHLQSGLILFNTLEEFVGFIHNQFHSVNNYGKTLKVGICTGDGGIDITIKKGVIGGKNTPEHC